MRVEALSAVPADSPLEELARGHGRLRVVREEACVSLGAFARLVENTRRATGRRLHVDEWDGSQIRLGLCCGGS